jgi:hypothetical protein
LGIVGTIDTSSINFIANQMNFVFPTPFDDFGYHVGWITNAQGILRMTQQEDAWHNAFLDGSSDCGVQRGAIGIIGMMWNAALVVIVIKVLVIHGGYRNNGEAYNS